MSTFSKKLLGSVQAVLPNYLKTVYANEPKLAGISTILAVHNLSYQGMFDPRNISELDFDDGKSPVAPFFSDVLNKQNFMKRGIIYSDLVVTVSPTYSREVLTPQFGEGLDKLLTEVRGKLYGVLNGIDYEVFNPSSDPLIEKNYDISTLDNRVANKIALQKEFDLKVSENTPMLGFVGRLDFQKGIDLVLEGVGYLIREFGVQFVLVGGGDTGIATKARELKAAFPKNVGVHTMPNFTLPRMLFSGCDMILYPSRFEPCGIVQLEAMRYGAIPIVRKVGGLADTVEDFDPETKSGTGFVFEEFNVISFYGQLVRAVETYRHKDVWRQIQVNAMQKDFSWSRSAKDYVRIYNKSIDFKHRLPENYQTSGM
jgi:starch synthase